MCLDDNLKIRQSSAHWPLGHSEDYENIRDSSRNEIRKENLQESSEEHIEENQIPDHLPVSKTSK